MRVAAGRPSNPACVTGEMRNARPVQLRYFAASVFGAAVLLFDTRGGTGNASECISSAGKRFRNERASSVDRLLSQFS